MNDDQLGRALRALADQDAGCQAPARAEARLLGALRTRRRKSAAWRAGLAAAVVITAIVVAAEWRWTRPSPVLPPANVSVAVQEPKPELAPVPVPRRAARTEPARAKEIATDFFPLMDAPPPFERGELVRVTLPASSMRVVGLPVREERLLDPVQADVLIGEEGMARAIRFVSFEQR